MKTKISKKNNIVNPDIKLKIIIEEYIREKTIQARALLKIAKEIKEKETIK